MKIKTLISRLILFSLSGCGVFHLNWIEYNGKKQAPRNAYSLSRKPFFFSDLIDTSAVYINQNTLSVSDRRGSVLQRNVTYYSYLRFSNRGIAVSKNLMLDYPTDEIINNKENGQYCFYIVKDSVVKIEKYNYNLKRFDFWYGRIMENGDIYFYKYKGRPWATSSGKLEYLYRKTPANYSEPLEFPTKDWSNDYYFQ